jgi:hypothetical protein
VAEAAAVLHARTTAGKCCQRPDKTARAAKAPKQSPFGIAFSRPLCVRRCLRFAGRKVLAKPAFDNVLLRGRYDALIFRDTTALAIFSHQILTLVEDLNQAVLFGAAAVPGSVDNVGLSHYSL